MSFREKSAWITLITLLLVSAFFFLHLPPLALAHDPSPALFHVFGAGVVAFVALALIALKATSIAAKVYVALSMASVSLVHFGANGIGVGWVVLFSFVLAEMVNCVARIGYHRRGV